MSTMQMQMQAVVLTPPSYTSTETSTSIATSTSASTSTETSPFNSTSPPSPSPCPYIPCITPLPVPTLPSPDTILIRIHAVALTHVDQDVITRKMDVVVKGLVKQDSPLLPGYAFSGMVTSRGTAVTLLEIGQAVVGISPMYGTCAQYSVQKAEICFPKPCHLSHTAAASLLIPTLESHIALSSLANIHHTDTLLFIPRSYSSDLIPFHHMTSLDIHTIIITHDHITYNTWCEYVGKHIIRVIDATREDVITSVMDQTGGRGVDVIWDQRNEYEYEYEYEYDEKQHDQLTSKFIYTPPSSSSLLSCLSTHSRWITSSSHLHIDPPMSWALCMRNASIHYLCLPVWMASGGQYGKYMHLVRSVMADLSCSTLVAPPIHVFPIDQIRQAYRCMCETRVGAVVISLT